MALPQDDFLAALLCDTARGTSADSHCAASRSARIASCFLELEKVNQDLESKLRSDFSNILNSMDRLSLSPTSQPASPSLDSRTRSNSSIQNSSFSSMAYSWLLENIANPYPSSTVKASLAERHNCPLSSVNTWFINARRRMGWTALCRDYFNNCRADTLDAAYRALIDEDPNRPLPPNVIHAFIAVKVTAESLYSSTVTKSALAGDLDTVVKNVTDQDTVSPGERNGFNGVVDFPETSEAELQNKQPVAQYYYSSDGSCSSSPVPPLVASLTDDSEEEEEILPPILVGRKRRLSCSEPTLGTGISTPTTKRRKDVRSTCHSVENYLSSGVSLDILPRNQEPRLMQISQNSTHTLHSRKRPLSDINATGASKRPEQLIGEPYLHATSDPRPLSTLESDDSLDEWFNANFDTFFTLPPPVDVVEPEPSAQWEVELFRNYNLPPEEPQRLPLKSFNTPIGDQSSLDSLELDNFLRSLESGGLVAPTEIVNPAINISIADFSVPRDLMSSESVDWTGLLNWEPSNSSLDSILRQCPTGSLPLSEIDLSILQLPDSFPS